MAARDPGIHLSEHGGTGDGVIRALAGTGLRLSGSDGRIRANFPGCAGEVFTAASILAQTNIEEIRDEGGLLLGPEEKVLLGEKVKSVLLNGKIVLLVESNTAATGKARWVTLSREKIRKY